MKLQYGPRSADFYWPAEALSLRILQTTQSEENWSATFYVGGDERGYHGRVTIGKDDVLMMASHLDRSELWTLLNEKEEP